MPWRSASRQEVAGQRVLAEHHRRGDVLAAVDDVGRLQALGVEPAHVGGEQLLELRRCQARLGLGRHVLGDELDGLVDHVDRPRGDGVETVRLAADDDGGENEHGNGGEGGEGPRDRLHPTASVGPSVVRTLRYTWMLRRSEHANCAATWRRTCAGRPAGNASWSPSAVGRPPCSVPSRTAAERRPSRPSSPPAPSCRRAVTIPLASPNRSPCGAACASTAPSARCAAEDVAS